MELPEFAFRQDTRINTSLFFRKRTTDYLMAARSQAFSIKPNLKDGTFSTRVYPTIHPVAMVQY